MSEVQALVLFILREVLHYLPWFLIAVVLGISVQRLSIDVVARRSFSRRGVAGVAIVTAIGAFSPFCSFTVIPLIRRFLIAGVPLSAVMSFWIASPSMDPEIYALSAAQLGFPVATARLVGALVLSFGAGLIVLALERRGRFRDPLLTASKQRAAASSCGQDTGTASPAGTARPAGQAGTANPAGTACPAAQTPATVAAGGFATTSAGPAGTTEGAAPAGGCSGSVEPDADPLADDDGTPWRVLVRRDIRNLRPVEILKEIWGDSIHLGRWLLLAIVLEALIIRYVPGDVVSSLLGTEGAVSVLLAGAVSVPLYLNGVGAIPVVEGLLSQGMVAAAGVTFLLGGAVTTIPAMVAVKSVVKLPVFAFYLAVGFLGSIGLGLLALPLM
ncbi:permease [Streptomyces ovatisporus]|uniref:Permease n=1 Tax=Streptomyces ovatisporus TaxID=1128682 RepID=A0ABV9A6W5_9ACTN